MQRFGADRYYRPADEAMRLIATVGSLELDDQAINGDGSAPNLTGMIKRLEGIANPTDPTARSFDLYVEGFTSAIDGLWATRAAEVGIVAGPLTYRQSAGTFRDPASGTAGGRGMVSFADYAMEHYGGWWTNSRMPDAASDIQRAIAYRMGRSGMGADAGMRTAVLPHWGECYQRREVVVDSPV